MNVTDEAKVQNESEMISKSKIHMESRIACKSRWDSIAKPLGSLGRLEEVLIQIAGIQGTHQVEIRNRALLIMCADNGVVDEGVTQTGSEITALVAENFLEHNSCVCIMAKQAGVDVIPIDIGMNRDTRVHNRKIAYGTKNMRFEPAMTREEAIRAIETGMQLVKECKEKGYQILATGEMGIGNTTTSSAMAAVLLQLPVETVTGKGAGLSKEGIQNKIKVIEAAIDLHEPNDQDPIDVLSKVGGFDIAGLVGICLGGEKYKIPVVLDGFISTVAALTAVRISKGVKEYLIPSHKSNEKAGGLLMEALDLEPFLTCNMCLGEGTGAVAIFPLLDMAVSVYETMSTFSDIEMEAYKTF